MSGILTLTIEPDVLAQSWVIYTLADISGKVQYIGFCRFAQLPATPDARTNRFFTHIFPPGRPFVLNVLSLQQSRRSARNAVWEWIHKNGRPMMLQYGAGHSIRRGLSVMCIDTGESFANSRAACMAHGLTPSALSNHLSGRPGFATVRGKKYKYSAPAVLLHEHRDPLYYYTYVKPAEGDKI